MPSAEYDLRYLRGGLNQLEDYLLSSEIYWSIGVSAPPGEPPYSQLTLGGLLLARQRAEATANSPTEETELVHLARELDIMRSRWRVAWEKKAGIEFGARLTLWRDFLEAYRRNPEENYDRYAYEVGRRVLLHILSLEVKDLFPAEVDLLNGLDTLLRAVIVPGEFVWDSVLAPSFPQETYWYLYGQVPERVGQWG